MLIRLTYEGETLHETSSDGLPATLTIGRSAQCEWSLPTHFRDVSGRHARLVRQDGRIAIEDLNSKNGLRFQGAKIGARVLSVGDQIGIGECALEVLDEPQTAPPASGRMPALAGCSHHFAGARFPLQTLPFKIGRGRDEALRIDDPNVSEHHAEIEAGGDGVYRLKDCRSQNGTFLNGRRLAHDEAVPLRGGDRIEIVYWLLRFDDGTNRLPEQRILRMGLALVGVLLLGLVAAGIWRPGRNGDGGARTARPAPGDISVEGWNALRLDEAARQAATALDRPHDPRRDPEILAELQAALARFGTPAPARDDGNLLARARTYEADLVLRIARHLAAAVQDAARTTCGSAEWETQRAWVERAGHPEAFKGAEAEDVARFLSRALHGIPDFRPPGPAQRRVTDAAAIFGAARDLQRFLDAHTAVVPRAEDARTVALRWSGLQREQFERLVAVVRAGGEGREARIAAAIALEIAPDPAATGDDPAYAIEGLSIRDWARRLPRAGP